MKKIRIIAMLLALVALCACFVSCDNKKDDEVKGGNKMNVIIMVYSSVDPDTHEKYTDGDSPIIGAANGIDIEYAEGEKVGPKKALEALAAERKATITFTASESVDTIVFDKTTYKSDRFLNKNRKGTQKSSQGNEVYDVYYYDLVMWEWTLNGTVINSVKDTELKDGDKLVLKLICDDTSTANYERCDSVDNAE